MRVLTSTVGTVCAATGLGSLVDIDAGDDQVLGVELIGNCI